jgi:hypothetical protein
LEARSKAAGFHVNRGFDTRQQPKESRVNGLLCQVCAAGLGCLAVSGIIGCGPAADERPAAVEAADDRRIAALVSADTAQLAPLLSADLRYVHSNGTVDDKASFLDLIGSGRTRYVAYDPVGRACSFPGPGMALETGTARLRVENAEGAREMTLAFLAVWRWERGAWRFLAWQSARLPAAADCAEPQQPAAAAAATYN